MTYQPTANDLLVNELMEKVEEVMGKEFAARLSDARCQELIEAEDRAVAQHGRQILAAIEGTIWAPEGNFSLRDVTESRLAQVVVS